MHVLSLSDLAGDRSREANPTQYRDPDVYDALFQSVAIPAEDKSGTYVYEMTLSKPVDTYILVSLQCMHNLRKE